MLYQRMCSDPLLVFRHMEEKAIATFMPEFWIEKALVYGEIGDYVNCFESLDLAQSRVEEDQE